MQMIGSIQEPYALCQSYFQLMSQYVEQHAQAGDVVLTGTPAGVGPLAGGDRLELRLAGRWSFAARVA